MAEGTNLKFCMPMEGWEY